MRSARKFDQVRLGAEPSVPEDAFPKDNAGTGFG
jgi:hypothetical protein